MSKAYFEGFDARLSGVNDNPHLPMTKSHHDWEEGWKDQDYHLVGRDDALDSIGWFEAHSTGHSKGAM